METPATGAISVLEIGATPTDRTDRSSSTTSVDDPFRVPTCGECGLPFEVPDDAPTPPVASINPMANTTVPTSISADWIAFRARSSLPVDDR